MSRVLIIKEANFEANRVAQVDLDSNVPCTGISLSESSITVTDDDDVTVEYTVTPSNTTDSISWSSSDETVATVDDGEVEIVGIGTTTITVACGSFSDTLTLTADLYARPDWYKASGSSAIITDSNSHSIVRINGSASLGTRIVGAQDPDNSDFTIPLFDGNSIINARPIKIPKNTSKIHWYIKNIYNSSGNTIHFVSAKESETYADTITSCKAISSENLTGTSNVIDTDVTVPTGADAFVVDVRLKSTPAEGTTLEQAIAACESSLHFLSAT